MSAISVSDERSLKKIESSIIMEEIYKKALKIAKVDANTLITGETGSGKTYFAKYIHNNSIRKSGPFISINCSAIPSTLLESELFGYKKGAFTGAASSGQIGKLELGNKGTVFLDEIGELTQNMQVKILHMIEEKSIMPLGDSKNHYLDIRIIAATNADLEYMIKEKSFRQDLFYRLNVLTLEIPPLREHHEDIKPFLVSFLQQVNSKYNVNKTLDRGALECLLNYAWPGNIRELRNVIEHLVVFADSDIIYETDLPQNISSSPNIQAFTSSLKARSKTFERKIIIDTLNSSKSIRQAAGKLGISHPTLIRKMRQLNIVLNYKIS